MAAVVQQAAVGAGTISVVAIFAFIGADDFLWPLIVLTDPNKYTLTVGLQYLSGTFSNNPASSPRAR